MKLLRSETSTFFCPPLEDVLLPPDELLSPLLPQAASARLSGTVDG
jgi:hypothetical protein